MSLEREQLLEISPYRAAHDMPVLPSSKTGLQCVQECPGIRVHPCLGQTVRFRDTVTVDLFFSALPLLLFVPLCIKCDQSLRIGASSLLFGSLALFRFCLLCYQSTIPLQGHLDIGKHGHAEQNGQYGSSNGDSCAILAHTFAKEIHCRRRLGSQRFAGEVVVDIPSQIAGGTVAVRRFVRQGLEQEGFEFIIDPVADSPRPDDFSIGDAVSQLPG